MEPRSDRWVGVWEHGKEQRRGKNFPTEKNTRNGVGKCVCVGSGPRSSGVWCGLGVGPGQKAAMSQATNAQLERSEKKLAKSWGAGQRDNTD